MIRRNPADTDTDADALMNWKRTLTIALMVLMAVTTAAAPVLAAGASGSTPAIQQNASAADLAVEQPRYVTDPVRELNENGTRLYQARGQYLEIEPQNFNITNVTAFSVREDEGLLSYDKSDREYVLNTQGNVGTFHLRWTVSTADGTRVYTANIRVLKADYAHVPQEQYSQLKTDATRGEDIISRFENAGDPDESVDSKVAFSVNVLEFKHNPFSVFTGQFMALQILRFSTPAGWADLALIIGIVYALTRGLYATIARLRKQLEKEEQVARREDEQYLSMYKSVLSGKQLTDVDGIDDHQAAVLERSLGTNLFTALRNFWTTWGASNLKRMYADAMGAVGYAARVQRDDAGNILSVDVLDPADRSPLADGGEPEPEDGTDRTGPGGDPGVADLGGRSEEMSLSTAPDDVLDTLTWDQIDDRVFQQNPDISAVDHLMTANRERPGDLISDLQISVPEDFQSRKEFMEAIGHFLQAVQETEFTDEQNYPREDRAVLNHVMAFTSIMEQEYDIPLDLWWRACVWNADGLSRDDEAESVLADITDAGAVLDEYGGGSNA